MYVDLWDETICFGTHKGKRLKDVPTGYLQWMLKALDEMTASERSAVRAEFLQREAQTKHRHAPPPPPPGVKLPAGVTPDLILQIVQTGRQQLAKRLHPDVGGDTEVMKRVNQAADFLEQQTRALMSGGTRP